MYTHIYIYWSIFKWSHILNIQIIYLIKFHIGRYFPLGTHDYEHQKQSTACISKHLLS